jgi:DNA-binding CsgD family transcriptional regulator
MQGPPPPPTRDARSTSGRRRGGSALAAIPVRPGPGDAARLEALAEELRAGLDSGLVRIGVVRSVEGAALEVGLAPRIDPLDVVLGAALGPVAPALRWAVVLEGTAPAILPGRTAPPAGGDPEAARRLLLRVRARRDRLAILTGDPSLDGLLEPLAPLLGELLADLTARQRTVVRLLLVDGLRQADVAERIGVARATVSVMASRSHARSIERLVTALRALLA